MHLKALVDSGASINFISPKAARRLRKETDWDVLKNPMVLKLGDGSSAARKLEYFLRVNQSFVNGSCVDFPVVICDLSDDFDLVLGKRWLRDLSVVQDHSSNQITVKTPAGRINLGELKDKSPVNVGYNELCCVFGDSLYISDSELKRLQKENQIEQLFMIHVSNQDHDQDQTQCVYHVIV